MKTLVIAEKPSVAKDLARVLKCGEKHEGYLANERYFVTWAIGHLVTLCEPEDYDAKLKRWSMDTLPIFPQQIKLKSIYNTRTQLNIIKKLINDPSVSSLICATDSGREGELIFRYIYSLLKCRKPFKRLWISSMTDEAIKNGMANLRDGHEFDGLYHSAKCRSEADWLVGINATRAYSLMYKTLLSIGRVQTPTLNLIVMKQDEIDCFVPKDYWEVKADFGEYSGTWINSDNDTKIFELLRAQEILNKIENKSGIVESVETQEKIQPHYLLYDLTELQRDCNKRFGFTAQKTLSIAQDLYEKRKLITYPRTNSRYLSSDMKGKIQSTLKSLKEYEEFTSMLDFTKLPITKRIVDDSKITDHHAIIPTGASVNKNLTSDERRVYDLIARRFISVFFPPFITLITKVITIVEGEPFLSKGTAVLQMGFMILYDYDKPQDHLPKLENGQAFPVVKAELLSKKTQPPKPYTEASLLSAMENAGRFVEDEDLRERMKASGLGTPATRAAIIERLIKVEYIQRKGKTLMPTAKGKMLISILPNELKSPETTGKWERGLTSIAEGRMESTRFMESIQRFVDFIINSCKETKNG